MKKVMLVLALLLLCVVYIPANSQAAVSTFYYDPVGDVSLANAVGGRTPAPSHTELDVVTMSSSESSGLGTTWIEFEIVVTGNIEDSEQAAYVLLIKANTGEYLIKYGDGKVKGVNAGNNQPVVATAQVSGDTLTVSVQKAQLGNPTNINWKVIAVKQIDDDTQYIDMAPDRLVRVMRPFEGSTLHGTVTIAGRTTPSIKPITDVQIEIDNTGQWTQVTPDSPGDWSTWTYLWPTTSVTKGQHTIRVRAKHDSERIEDEPNGDILTIYVDQSAATSPDSFTETMIVNVGDRYEYQQVEPSEFGFGNIGSLDSAVQEVVGYTDSYAGTGTGAWIIGFETRAQASIAGFTATQVADAVTWRDTTNYNILEERLNSSLESGVMGDNEVNSTTKYNPSLDDFDDADGMRVTKSWTETTYSDTDYRTYSSKHGAQNHQDDKTITIYFECLRKETINVFGTNYETYLIHSEEEGSDSYDIQYYAPEIDTVVKLEKYDFNRMRLASLGLSEYVKGDGVDIRITSASVSVDEIEEGKDLTITVEVTNTGNNDATDAFVTLLHGSTEIEENAFSIASGATDTITFTWKAEGSGETTFALKSGHGTKEDDDDSVSFTVKDTAANGSTTIPTWLIAVIVLVLVAIIAAIAMKKRGGAAPIQAAPAAATEEEITCPKCGKTSYAIIDHKPMQMDCPFCGAKLTIK